MTKPAEMKNTGDRPARSVKKFRQAPAGSEQAFNLNTTSHGARRFVCSSIEDGMGVVCLQVIQS
jgi:hypothetical protein